jgi:hypothetical protein
MNFICKACGTDKNVYSSPDCWYRMWGDGLKPHYFCMHCLFYFSNNKSEFNDGIASKLQCQHCAGQIFKVENCQTGTKRGIDDLLRDFECFKMVHVNNFLTGPMISLDDVFVQIKRSFHMLSMSLYNGYSDEGRVMVSMQNLTALSRRFRMRPSTFEEYKTRPTEEIELFDWSLDDKCADCHAVINLYQCVNKSECSHICCLKCFLDTFDRNLEEHISCPICWTYRAGTLEHYRTKQTVNGYIMARTRQAAQRHNTCEEAIEFLQDNGEDSSVLEAQPELFKLLKTFDSEISIRE